MSISFLNYLEMSPYFRVPYFPVFTALLAVIVQVIANECRRMGVTAQNLSGVAEDEMQSEVFPCPMAQTATKQTAPAQ